MTSKTIGNLLVEKTQEGIKAAAAANGLLVDGKVDLRGQRARLNHSDLDLREFLFEGADLSGSDLTNCIGEGVHFDRCTLRKVRITAEKAKKVSFRGASFAGALFDDAWLGPRTLDLSGTIYTGAKLRDVTFMLGRLDGADFSGAKLVDVYFRSGELSGTSFRNASLTRVSFEKAVLAGADFTDSEFDEMEHWGEPNFDGAIISDELRYQYGIVNEPLRKIDALIARSDLGEAATAALRRLRTNYADFLSAPAAMLIGAEMDDAVPRDLFPTILKALKREP